MTVNEREMIFFASFRKRLDGYTPSLELIHDIIAISVQFLCLQLNIHI